MSGVGQWGEGVRGRGKESRRVRKICGRSKDTLFRPFRVARPSYNPIPMGRSIVWGKE